MNTPVIDAVAVKTALQAEATDQDLRFAQQAYGRWGAHRAYVVVSGTIQHGHCDYSSRARRAALKAIANAGAKVLSCHGCDGQGLYLGLDNFEGGKLAARGEAIARALAEAGIAARVDAAGD